MDTKTSKRKDKHYDEEDNKREKRTKRRRSRSRSREDRDRDGRRKRRHSRSRSPYVPSKDKRRDEAPNDAPIKKDVPERKAKDTDMLNTRTGGAYIPPARLRMMQAQITDKSSVAYQRLAWEALKKSIHGHINKINVGNIGIIIKELLKENIVRGRGLLCRSVIQAQAASPTFTNVYAALVAAVNSRFPNIGELLLKRLVIQFKRGFKRNDKPICISSASFIAHLVNQRVAHEILALELLTLLVESPTDDSVEVAIAFLKECGQKLTEVSSKGVNAIFEMLRNILHEGQLDKRVQYMIEVMFQVWKDGFKDHPALIEELELVSEEEQFTHLLMLDEATDSQDILNVFKFDEKYEDNEQKYKTLSKEILGSDAESGEDDGSEGSGSEESDDEEDEEGEKAMTIIDNTETNLVALRRTIYLTINSSLDFEECAHKLMKMQLKPGQEVELCHMFLDCCAEQRTYEKFYGLLAQRFCNINRMYIGPFEEIFKDSYSTAHRLDTNRLRNVSKFFAHLLFTDSISWEVMECVRLNEEDTTSSSRIYIKILFQELAEYMGLKKLNDRLKDPTLQEAFSGIFPRDNPKNTRFSINFFTSIGLGGLTDELREHLKQMPKNVPAAVTDINVESESSSDSSSSSSSSDSSSSSSDSSSSDSEEETTKKKKSKKSKEKEKTKSNDLPDEAANNKNDKDKRWGHDGFYDTYGENAQRYEGRSERFEQNRDNFARPADPSRRHDDRNRQRENDRGSRDERSNRDLERRRNDRGDRETKDIDNRTEREHRERRRESPENKRNERNAKQDSRYDKDRSDEGRRCEDNSRREGRENRQDRDQRRDRDEHTNRSRDNDRTRNREDLSNSRSNRDDYRNSDHVDREKEDKGFEKNDRVREEDRSKNRHKENSSITRTKDKNMRREESNGTNRKEKYDDINDENESRSRHKEGKKDEYRSKEGNGDEYRSKEGNRDEYRSKEGNRDEYRSKEGNRDEYRSKEGNRDEYRSKEGNRDEYRSKEGNGDERRHKEGKSRDDDRSREKGERNRRGDTNNKDDEIRNKAKKKSTKDKRESKKDKYKEKESSSSEESESESVSQSSADENTNEQSGARYWDVFDIGKEDVVHKYTKENERTPELQKKQYDKRRER